MSEQVKHCPTCNHCFYHDAPMSDGRCKYCHEDDANPHVCYVCGRTACCRGEKGYLCADNGCCYHDDLQRRNTDEIGWDDAAI